MHDAISKLGDLSVGALVIVIGLRWILDFLEKRNRHGLTDENAAEYWQVFTTMTRALTTHIAPIVASCDNQTEQLKELRKGVEELIRLHGILIVEVKHIQQRHRDKET